MWPSGGKEQHLRGAAARPRHAAEKQQMYRNLDADSPFFLLLAHTNEQTGQDGPNYSDGPSEEQRVSEIRAHLLTRLTC